MRKDLVAEHQGRHVAKSVSGRKAANPPTGFGPVRKGRFAQRVPAWGAFGW